VKTIEFIKLILGLLLILLPLFVGLVYISDNMNWTDEYFKRNSLAYQFRVEHGGSIHILLGFMVLSGAYLLSKVNFKL
jgi:hypothetical protein